MLNTTVWLGLKWKGVGGTAFNELVQRLVWLWCIHVGNNHNFCSTHKHFCSLHTRYSF